ncbi:type II CRISPR RNA-guided endonuclease Cas9 [Bacteroides fluxus]|uniref:type II CRISPR RNA-guided endonuclease Cas9 n=1 Tax=Bacteroides fluxus TaxID=626930 RepID=UPI0023555C17|nr:type II CRISPR RNA-guided endonuclease Cas9 [Bacteroides fluxus]
MKRILGLDMGSASIGWAIIEEDGNVIKIIALGSRIIPYNGTEGQDFVKGAGETRDALRTKNRTARKGYDRYQLRRKYLVDVLVKNDMMPDESLKCLSKMQLWELRNKAVTEYVSKQELGRILLWLNQKRGYKSSRSEANLDKKDTEYVAAVKCRYEMIKEKNLTIGQCLYNELCSNEYFRIKENVFPREAYIEEFDKICEKQKKHLGLTDELIARIRNEIIYYQRPLKSQKGLVAVCDFEGFYEKTDGKERFVGPKVAPKSSPLFQLAKIWESVNNIKLSTISGENVELTLEEKKKIIHHLDNNGKLTSIELFKILHKNKKDFIVPRQLEKGIQGNIVKVAIIKILGEKYSELLKFDLTVIEEIGRCGYLYDKKTGEVLNEKTLKCVDSKVEKEPYYQLWHTIYSINDVQECSNALQKGIIIAGKAKDGDEVRVKIDKETADKLAAIDFNKLGFGNKSAKAIRKILPYLMEGDKYSEAMSYAGYDHSVSWTRDENLRRGLLDKLKPIAKNSLRQPIVEKILNQMVNLVNAIIEKYGKPDEIRIELARELKQSKDERNAADLKMSKRQRENEIIASRLEEYGLRATKNNISKYRLYEEIENQGGKLNAICVYCGQPISRTEAILGREVDVEHIIPKSKLFDDSQSNKTLAHRRCNSFKNDMTAYDFMKTKPKQEFDAYVERVGRLYSKNMISRAKRDKLLMSEDEIPDNFIDRQLRESQYIAKKTREILQTVCCNVWATSGTVTAELRHLWGWDDITMNLQMHKYKELGLTETVVWESEHGKRKHSKEVIKGWTKRDDHRHHAIDALIIACTKQGFIQRFNTLNASKTREDMQSEIEKSSVEYKEKLTLLEKYIISQCPLSVEDVKNAVSQILVSFKSGKKVAVWGKRRVYKNGKREVVQDKIIVPRGALSEQFVYGRIRAVGKEKKMLKYLFNNSHLISNSHIKTLVEQRLNQYGNDIEKALASVKDNPIYLDADKTNMLEYGTCFEEKFVMKYNVDVNFTKTEKVVDEKIRNILQTRLQKFGGKSKEAFKDVQYEEKSLKWYEDEKLERPIHSVRCFTGLSAVVPIKKDEYGNEIGFVKPGNNHHIAIYVDKDGNKIEHVCTFWHAVERKKYGIPVIIKDTNDVWDKIWQQPDCTYPQSFLEQLPTVNLEMELSMQQNEMFVLEMAQEDVKVAIENNDYKTISEHLYRVNSLSSSDYYFYHHLETKKDIKNTDAKESKRYFRFKSVKALFLHNPVKVKIDCLGNIIQ